MLSFGELMSRGEKARRIFRQLERVVRQQRTNPEPDTQIIEVGAETHWAQLGAQVA